MSERDKSKGYPTVIGIEDACCCFLKASMISLIDGSKRSATTFLERHQHRALLEKVNLPSEPKLARAYVILRVFIADGTKLYVLGILSIAKTELGRLVKNLRHLFQYFWATIF